MRDQGQMPDIRFCPIADRARHFLFFISERVRFIPQQGQIALSYEAWKDQVMRRSVTISEPGNGGGQFGGAR